VRGPQFTVPRCLCVHNSKHFTARTKLLSANKSQTSQINDDDDDDDAKLRTTADITE